MLLSLGSSFVPAFLLGCSMMVIDPLPSFMLGGSCWMSCFMSSLSLPWFKTDALFPRLSTTVCLHFYNLHNSDIIIDIPAVYPRVLQIWLPVTKCLSLDCWVVMILIVVLERAKPRNLQGWVQSENRWLFAQRTLMLSKLTKKHKTISAVCWSMEPIHLQVVLLRFFMFCLQSYLM